MKTKPFIHPATPPKLVSAFRKAKNNKGQGYKWHVLEENIGVNVKILHDLIAYGKEPTDRTEHGRATRVKIFLPRRKRRKRGEPTRPYTEPPEEIKWWRSLKKDKRREIIQTVYQLEGGAP